ncbi:ubiquinone biosynthesis accessory factor UbiJ [Marinobacter sp. UBA3607]|jgi:ubiquinone biosynthesis protein UbiJ|uniref:ubiquinone biosynthesis accessory factor UbiJ n=1 Tax=Marinobacter sp. UBA3607 TaxID=1946820 RepID=UPI00257BBA3E|nr:SCP2 sterol-binding domain-containing protein [Marinobacter sp. UBA3607]|tara:strand:- start:14233 stop:14874 length:642 start_codon:yes stop_codon:yes gene_type:complete
MFPGPTLLSAISAIIEAALNRALELDPAGHKGLMQALAGPVQFSLTAPVAMSWTLEPVADRVQVRSQPADDPALEISGRPVAFAALALGDDRVFADERLQVQGDTALAHQFQRALNQLQPDWEAAMARHIGDVPAHFLGQRIRNAAKWSQQAVSTMNANVEEYIHEESRTLPGRRELEATFQDIDELNLRTERLEARLNQLAAPGSINDTETL